MSTSAMDVLIAARRVADYASGKGVTNNKHRSRGRYNHMGMIIADSVLQSGLNYINVVRPRVQAISRAYPEMDRTSALHTMISKKMTNIFLNWNHPQKIKRFEHLVFFLYEKQVESASDLRDKLLCDKFRQELGGIHGVGPKTIDYMACLVGIDSIAVDRHVKNFAIKVGIEVNDYDFLRSVFCCAADLLALPRREFDAWVWESEASLNRSQLCLAI